MSRVWLITDGGSGVGRVLAEAVLAAGDRVVAGARDAARLADLVEAHAERVLPVALVTTDEAAVYAALGAALQAFGRLDVVVDHCADDAGDEHDFRAAFASRFFGSVGVAHAALALMQEQGSGHIVQLSTPASRSGVASSPAHRAAHAALRVFSQALAAEATPSGIRVSFVEAGDIDACIGILLEDRDLAAIASTGTEPARRPGCARREATPAHRAASADVLPFPPRPVAA